MSDSVQHDADPAASSCCHVWGEWGPSERQHDGPWARRVCIYCGASQEVPVSDGFLLRDTERPNPLEPFLVPLLQAINRTLLRFNQWLNRR